MTITGIGTSTLSGAIRSIRAQYARYGEAAERIAAGEGDMARNVADLKAAENGARFGVAVAKTILDLQRSLVDVLA